VKLPEGRKNKGAPGGENMPQLSPLPSKGVFTATGMGRFTARAGLFSLHEIKSKVQRAFESAFCKCKGKSKTAP